MRVAATNAADPVRFGERASTGILGVIATAVQHLERLDALERDTAFLDVPCETDPRTSGVRADREAAELLRRTEHLSVGKCNVRQVEGFGESLVDSVDQHMPDVRLHLSA